MKSSRRGFLKALSVTPVIVSAITHTPKASEVVVVAPEPQPPVNDTSMSPSSTLSMSRTPSYSTSVSRSPSPSPSNSPSYGREEYPPRQIDWDMHDGYYNGTCEMCGKDNVRVVKDVDPYLAEMFPDEPNEERDWCYLCFSTAAEQI
jgi:hypothetical protein